MEKEFYTIHEVADLLGLSRIAIYKRVKSGSIKAKKRGRIFIISKEEVERLTKPRMLSELDKKNLKKIVRRVVVEYGSALKKLGNE